MKLLKFFETESIFRRKILLFVTLLIFLFSILEIWVVNRLATFGEQINKLSITKSNLELENQMMQNQIARLSSLHEIEKEAINLGFEKIRNIEYINTL